MFLDVVDLRNFYSQPLGVVARRLLSDAVRARWPSTRGLALVGIGYATPYLGVFRNEVERTFALMPSRQGVVKWPTASPSLSALVEESQLPLPDASVDRVLAVHALEMTIHAPDMLREVWRNQPPGRNKNPRSHGFSGWSVWVMPYTCQWLPTRRTHWSMPDGPCVEYSRTTCWSVS